MKAETVSRIYICEWVVFVCLMIVAVIAQSFHREIYAASPDLAKPIYDATMYVDKPDLAESGVLPVKFVYASAIWPQDADREQLPPEDHVRALAQRLPADQMLVLDIEHWDLSDQHVDWLIQIIQWMKDELPDRKIGYYLLLPERKYWTALADPASDKYKDWQARNRSPQRLRLAEHVDAIFPSLYTFYNDPAGWTAYARANIAEARVYGKPVYPVLWPQYHTGGAQPTELRGTNISASFWQQQLITAGTNADGVIIWGGYKTTWDENADWWQATVQYIDQHRITDHLQAKEAIEAAVNRALKPHGLRIRLTGGRYHVGAGGITRDPVTVEVIK